MDAKRDEDVKDTALKLDVIRVHCPEEYFYLKGWIHCLLQLEDRESGKIVKSHDAALMHR